MRPEPVRQGGPDEAAADVEQAEQGAKPAATTAMAASCAGSSWSNARATPIREPPNTSCSIGEAIPITPMPADTFRHSTIHTSQNCGVRKTFFTCTWSRS